MRNVLSRVVAIGTGIALTTIMLPAGPASAESSDSCAGQYRLLTTPILENDDNRLWVDNPSPTRTVVCFDFPFLDDIGAIGSGAIVADATASAVPPRVIPGDNPALCGEEVVHSLDPAVEFRVAFGFATSTVCFTIETETLSLTFDDGSITGTPPTIQIWRDGTFGVLDIAACPREWVAYVQAIGPADCMYANERIL